MFALRQITLFLSSFATASNFIIPPPNGSYGVNVKSLELIDTSRLDPFAPTPQNRSLVVSVFYPSAPANACSLHLEHYLPKKVAAFEDQQLAPEGVQNGTLEKLRLSLCKPSLEIVDQLSKTPVVLFSPGLGTSRLFYSIIAQAVASNGYVVVSVDHPYDADIVEFPDGKVVFAANISTIDQIAFDVQVRTADISFVVDQLQEPGFFRKVLPGSNVTLAANVVGMYGHSLGGAAQPTFSQIWPHLNWKLGLELLNSTHGSFSDFATLATLAGLGDPLPPALQQILGSIPGPRAVQVLAAYVSAFFDTVLKCKPSALLQRPSPTYPEIDFVAF